MTESSERVRRRRCVRNPLLALSSEHDLFLSDKKYPGGSAPFIRSTDVTEPEPEPEPDLIVPVVRSALGVRHSTFIGLYFLRPLHAHCFRPVSFFDGTLTFAQLFPRFERKVLHTSE